MRYDIFICHTHKDNDATNQLIYILKRELPGVKIWEDTDEAFSEEEYLSNMRHGISSSRFVIFVLSLNSLDILSDEYCMMTMMYAKEKKRKVIPCLLSILDFQEWYEDIFGYAKQYYFYSPSELELMLQEIKSLLGKNFADREDDQRCKTLRNIYPSKSVESQFYFDPVFGELKRKDSIDTGGNNSVLHTEVGEINGHMYVDLGLPSGTKWATCNIGANKPEQYGDCFGWGEIEVKDYCAEDATATFEKDIEWLQENGLIQEKGNLTLEHDVAHKQWGESWRMPTKEDIAELMDNTTSEYAIRRGVPGRLIKSKKNNSSIFLPNAGWFFPDSRIHDGGYGSYWSSTPNEDNTQYAFSFDIGKKECALCSETYRDFGHSVRPVSD